MEKETARINREEWLKSGMAIEEEGEKIIGGKPILSKTINISISLDRDLLEALNIASNAKNISRSVYIKRVLLKDKRISEIMDEEEPQFAGARTKDSLKQNL
ncbi:MAG: hypothetical protein ACYDAP_01385 [Thermoplasmataceae archaeon]